MRDRRAISPGGESSAPDDSSAKLPVFIDAIEELVRLGLRKALSMKDDAKNMLRSEYWDTLVLSESKPERDQAGEEGPSPQQV
jgi:hypothetical protein